MNQTEPYKNKLTKLKFINKQRKKNTNPTINKGTEKVI